MLLLLKERALGLKISARDRPGTYTQKRGDLLFQSHIEYIGEAQIRLRLKESSAFTDLRDSY